MPPFASPIVELASAAAVPGAASDANTTALDRKAPIDLTTDETLVEAMRTLSRAVSRFDERFAKVEAILDDAGRSSPMRRAHED